MPRAPVGNSMPRASVGNSMPRAPVGNSIPRVPVCNSMPRAPVGNSMPRVPVGNSMPRAPVTDTTFTLLIVLDAKYNWLSHYIRPPLDKPNKSICDKANKTLGSQRRNLNIGSTTTK